MIFGLWVLFFVDGDLKIIFCVEMYFREKCIGIIRGLIVDKLIIFYFYFKLWNRYKEM